MIFTKKKKKKQEKDQLRKEEISIKSLTVVNKVEREQNQNDNVCLL